MKKNKVTSDHTYQMAVKNGVISQTGVHFFKYHSLPYLFDYKQGLPPPKQPKNLDVF